MKTKQQKREEAIARSAARGTKKQQLQKKYSEQIVVADEARLASIVAAEDAVLAQYKVPATDADANLALQKAVRMAANAANAAYWCVSCAAHCDACADDE